MQYENPFEAQKPEEPSKAEEAFRDGIEIKVTQDMKRCIAESLNKLDVAFDYFDSDCDNSDGFICSAKSDIENALRSLGTALAAIDCWLDKTEGEDDGR
jgi:hypothetical protein